MPETTVVTYLNRTRFPASLTLHVPGTEKKNEKGEPVPGTGATVTFHKGKSIKVTPEIADMVLNGPAGMMKLTVQDGLPVLARGFVEGSIDDERNNDPAVLNEKVESLQAQLAEVLDMLKATGKVSPDALKSLGLSADDVVDEPEGKKVSSLDAFTVEDGGFERDDKGRFLCPHCREWATQPVSPSFSDAKAKKSLKAHIRMAHKELFETDASDTEQSE